MEEDTEKVVLKGQSHTSMEEGLDVIAEVVASLEE
jgi:hypothetical protein